jgi:hypothetical protein
MSALIFGTPQVYSILRMNPNKIDYIYVNFNSLVEGVEKLDALNPYWSSTEQVFFNEFEFDNMYISYITTSPAAFRQLVDLMRTLYNGYSVFIICDWNNDVSINMIEALMKFITDSYGFKCNICTDIMNDIISDGDFSTDGIQMFDRNMETYIQMFGTDKLYSDHGDLA